MRTNQHQTGLTMVELLVALAIGSFLMIGAVQIYSQSRHAFVINESIARIQETAQFAMDTIEADLRMASNWGRNSRALAVEGRSLEGNVNPKGLPAPTTCGADWALDLALAVDGDNNVYTLPCGAIGGVQANSDVVTVRRVAVAASALEAGRLQIQSTRIQGELIADGIMPPTYTAADSSTHNLIVNSYYVATDSNLIAGTPTLRRKSLTAIAGVPTIIDQEVAPGVENLQIQFGVDVDADNTVDRYVNPGDPVYDPAALGYIPGARVISARIWLIVRGVTIETGITDLRDYKPGDINLGVYNDAYRRMQVSKTILMRNTRS
jgi:type IV pilus assembly protein PilW